MDSKYTAFWIVIPIILVGILLLAKTNTLDIVSKDNYQELGYFALPTPKPIEPFSLENQLGEAVNADSLKGQMSLIFFGFTYCPDVCPTTLSILNLSLTSKTIKEKLKSPPSVIMVSVDPERDTPAILLPYIKGFNPEFNAYTGSLDEVTNLAQQLGAGFRKVAQGDEGNWTVDHSANIIVINKKGEYQGLIRPPHQAEKITNILQLLARES